MKKLLCVLLSAIMLISVLPISSFAIDIYEVVFSDLPYDVAPFRSDYVGKYMGYEYGVDYWYTITNPDGTTTDIKGLPYSVSVYAGDSLEFTVSVADYIEPESIIMLAFPKDLPVEELAPLDPYDPNLAVMPGAPYANYYINETSLNKYGVRPTEDINVCVSEYHLYNKAFMYTFRSSSYYTSARVQFNGAYENPWETYTPLENSKTKVVYENETLFFEVRIPLDDPDHDYHYDTYQVYYTYGAGSKMETFYLKKAAAEDGSSEAVDKRVAHYETDTEWVDVYAIENVEPTVDIRIAGTVTYTLSMLGEFFKDFDVENIDNLDLSTIDFAPMVEFIARLLGLILKILKGFGVSINIGG